MARARFDDKGFLALGLGFAAVWAAGALCAQFGLDSVVTQAVAAVAIGVPAAVVRVIQRSGDRGSIRPQRAPVGVRIALIGAVVLLYDTVIGMIGGAVGGNIALFVTLASIVPAFFAGRAVFPKLGHSPYLVLLGGFFLALVGRIIVAFVLFLELVRQVIEPEVLFALTLLYYTLLYATTAFGVLRAAKARPASFAGVEPGWQAPPGPPVAAGRSHQAPPAHDPGWQAPGPPVAAGRSHQAPPAHDPGWQAPSPPVASGRTYQAPPVQDPRAAMPSQFGGPVPGSHADPAPPAPVAGWYPDPELRGVLRWWDGQAWTQHRRNS